MASGRRYNITLQKLINSSKKNLQFIASLCNVRQPQSLLGLWLRLECSLDCIIVTLAYRIGDKSEIRFLRERPSMFKMIKLTIFVFLHKSTLQHLIYSYSITIYTNVPQMSPFMTL